MLEKEEIISPALEDLKNHYRSIITLLGEDAEREGLLKTPERVDLDQRLPHGPA
jgi:GTP cyclohydrolase I